MGVQSWHTVLAFLLAEGNGRADCFRLSGDYRETFHQLRSESGRRDLSIAIGRPVGEVAWERFDAQRAAMSRHGVRAVTFFDDDYPLYLRRIPKAPPILFYRGDLSCLRHRGVAIVGTRHPTARACDFTAGLAGDLAAMNIVVVSGAARGIDSAAHRGALEKRGKTVGVVGSGLDVPYPQENAQLLETMAQHGCVLGEQLMGTPPLRHTFPQRNRLISAFSHAVVVVEAGRRSGALLTASWALEQGREVGAVPGFPGDPRSCGVNSLLKGGAFPVEGVDDILEAAPRLRARASRPWGGPAASGGRVQAGLSAEANAILDVVGGHHADPDAVARHLKTSVARVQAILLELEIRGVVARDAMGMYHKS
ncbi:MAG: DNA-processing protein DprA [Candidatus Krumholzibacteria bacterium]